MAHDPGPLPLLDLVEAAFNAAGERMPWASTVAQRILDMPTMVRVAVEAELDKRLMEALAEHQPDRDLTPEEEEQIERAVERFMRRPAPPSEPST